MNNQDSQFASSAICFAADQIKLAWQEAATARQRPSILFKPSLAKDGNMWCALFGDNLQEGVAGFGETPGAAMWAFDNAWFANSGSYIAEPKDSKHSDTFLAILNTEAARDALNKGAAS